MEAEGEAISFVTSEEENDLHGIEKALGKTIPRVTLPDFDYKAPPPPKVRGREGGGPRYPREPRGGGGRPRGHRGSGGPSGRGRGRFRGGKGFPDPMGPQRLSPRFSPAGGSRS